MNKKSLSAVFLVVFTAVMLTFGVTGAYAHGGRGGYGHGFDLKEKFFWKAYMIQENQQELGLSDEKIDSVKSLVAETKKSLIRQKAELEVIEIDMKEKLRANPVDVQSLNDLIDQKFELKKTMMKGLVDSFAKLKQTLSDDQHKKLRELKKEHGKHGK